MKVKRKEDMETKKNISIIQKMIRIWYVFLFCSFFPPVFASKLQFLIYVQLFWSPCQPTIPHRLIWNVRKKLRILIQSLRVILNLRWKIEYFCNNSTVLSQITRLILLGINQWKWIGNTKLSHIFTVIFHVISVSVIYV